NGRNESRDHRPRAGGDPNGADEPPLRCGVGTDAATNLRPGTRDRRCGDSTASDRAGSITLSRCFVRMLNVGLLLSCMAGAANAGEAVDKTLAVKADGL